MAKSYASTVIEASCRRRLGTDSRLQRPCHVARRLVATSEIEDGNPGDQVGVIRSFTLADDTDIREKLLSHSDLERSYTYVFQKTPFDVDDYAGVDPGHPGHRRRQGIRRVVDGLDCDRDKQADWVGFFASQVFQGGFDALKAHFEE